MSSTSKYAFEYAGTIYKSMAECLRVLKIPDQSIFHIMRKRSCTAQEAIDVWKESHSRQQRDSLSLKEISLRYGIPYNTFRSNYNHDPENFIASRVENGFTLPDKITWVNSIWEPIDSKDYPLHVVGVEPNCYSDANGNLLIEFLNIDNISFKVQYQSFGIWLFQAGPCAVKTDFDISYENRNLWYGSWVADECGLIFLHCALVSKKTAWADVVKVVSVMTRICSTAIVKANVCQFGKHSINT